MSHNLSISKLIKAKMRGNFDFSHLSGYFMVTMDEQVIRK